MTTAASKGLVLFLIQASESMRRPVLACESKSGLRLSLDLAWNTIQKMQTTAADRLIAEEWEVSVVSLGAGEPPLLRSLLPGTTPSRPAVELATASPLSAWLDVPTSQGTPSPAELLSAAAALTREWLAGRSSTLRPLVVICLDGETSASDLERLSLGVRQLVASAGFALLAMCVFSPQVESPFPFFSAENLPLPKPWERLPDLTSPMRFKDQKVSAVSINDRPSRRLVKTIQQIGRKRPPATSPGWRFESTDAPRCESRFLWAPKDGNTAQEWEDGKADNLGRGLAVVADGASQGIFARQWADVLTRRWVADPPDASDRAGFEGWVSEARKEWQTGIGYDDLHGLNQDKVDEIGAGTALLALGLERIAGGHRWCAAAVGDVCLFWVRGSELLLTFPATCSADFGSTPDLVRTLKGRNADVRIMRAEGVGQKGDLYGLATDAVAQCLLRSHESGSPIDWERLWGMDDQEWRSQLALWRASRQIVNDDSTLLLLRVID